MLIQINLDVVNTEAEFRNLDRLLMLFENKQHEWYIENPNEIVECSWAQQLSERHQNILKKIIEKSFVRSANISKKEKKERGVLVIYQSEDSSLEIAMKFIDDPLFIVVENETSDSLFLNRLFEIYPNLGTDLQNAKKLNHLEYYPAGGRNETVKTIINISSKKSSPYKPRIFVFIDSDKKYPGQPHDAVLQEIVEHCEANNHSLHILYKREIENYLPKEVLQKCVPSELSKTTQEICNLNPHQWDFFDLEKGFKNSPPSDNDELYGEFSDKKNQKYINLKNGLQVDTKVFIAKKSLFRMVQDEEFNAKNVDFRCAHQPDKNELRNLLLKIWNKL
jgi:hypothetical protein